MTGTYWEVREERVPEMPWRRTRLAYASAYLVAEKEADRLWQETNRPIPIPDYHVQVRLPNRPEDVYRYTVEGSLLVEFCARAPGGSAHE